ncbi:MAG: signal peptidase II [Myxococcota bacterium]
MITPKLRILLGALLFTVPLDQLSKWWVDATLPQGDRVPIIEGFFYLTHARNAGAAFGLFDQEPAETRLISFIVVSLVAFVVIVSFFRRLAPRDRLTALALGMILGGATGNFIDRVMRGEVIDFLQFQLWGGYRWPDFNLADGFIIVGVSALIFDLLASEAVTRAGEPSQSDPG